MEPEIEMEINANSNNRFICIISTFIDRKKSKTILIILKSTRP